MSWRLGVAVIAASACLGAINPESVTIKLTSAGSNTMGGVYVNPYTALVDGVSTVVICDDFIDNTYVNEVWTAQPYNITDDLSGTRMAHNSGLTGAELETAYKTAAYLAIELLAEPNKTERGLISFALWSAFDNTDWNSGALASLGTSQRQRAQVYLTAAQQAVAGSSLASFSNVSIYSPLTLIGCPDASHPCPTGPPQELLVVRAVEPSALISLAVEMAGVLALFVFLRSRRRLA
jgi:hypothetical protein